MESKNLHIFCLYVPLLFKQPQFQRLELEVTSISFSSLQGILHLFFTAISPYPQTLKLNSITIFQQNMMPGTHVVPGHNTGLLKSLHLSNMELTPSQETLIFSYSLLQLESLTLINRTSVLAAFKVSGQRCHSSPCEWNFQSQKTSLEECILSSSGIPTKCYFFASTKSQPHTLGTGAL